MFRFDRKLALGLWQGFKMNKKFSKATIINKALEWTSDGSLLPAQHIITLHYQNRSQPFCPATLIICVKPIKKQIKFWRARIISHDFEAFPKGTRHLIAADFYHQIYCNKRIDPLPTMTITKDAKFLDEHHRNYEIHP